MFFHREQLATSGGIYLYLNRKGATGIQWVEARDGAKYLTMHRIPLSNKFLPENVNYFKAEPVLKALMDNVRDTQNYTCMFGRKNGNCKKQVDILTQLQQSFHDVSLYSDHIVHLTYTIKTKDGNILNKNHRTLDYLCWGHQQTH